MSKLTFLLIALLTSMVSIPLSGYTISTLWLWFIVPTFNLPTLSIPIAVGISALVTYTTGFRYLYKSEDLDTADLVDLISEQIGKAILVPIFLLIFCKILTLFM